MADAAGRAFLFLQGPHGPFFNRLAGALAARGAAVRKLAFNASDEAEWADAGPLRRFVAPPFTYAAWLEHRLELHRVTDIVLYGDSRWQHAAAVDLARRRGLRLHAFEEGYLRPHWITYERGGNNGNSPLNLISQRQMALALAGQAATDVAAPDGWGAARAHLLESARHHARLVLPSRHFGRYDSGRGLSLWHELGLYLRRAAGAPLRRVAGGAQMRRLAAAGTPYHLVLLQLSFDSSARFFSPFESTAETVETVVAAFARGAPAGDLLVFKAHPFEDGREHLSRLIERIAVAHGVAGRVRFVDSGRGLGLMLDHARTAVTVNSTAAQQALWRGLPVAALGRAVYVRPGLTSGQPLDAFFAAPEPPDAGAVRIFRRFLLATSQLPGSFYAKAGIAALVEALPDLMLAQADPYSRLLGATEALSAEPRSEPPPRRAANAGR